MVADVSTEARNKPRYLSYIHGIFFRKRCAEMLLFPGND
jgi:hypothetical protein